MYELDPQTALGVPRCSLEDLRGGKGGRSGSGHVWRGGVGCGDGVDMRGGKGGVGEVTHGGVGCGDFYIILPYPQPDSNNKA